MNLKYMIMDVDGTLTDGKIYMGENGEICKAFNIKDGYGIHSILPTLGIMPVIITGRKSKIVENRCKELQIEKCYQGVNDKKRALETFLEEMGGKASDVIYIGDDANDLLLMKFIQERNGIVACPADAILSVKKVSNYVAEHNGGEGAVRDVIDWVSGMNDEDCLS